MGKFTDQLRAFYENVGDRGDAFVREVVETAGERLIELSPAPEKGNPYSKGELISNWNYGLQTPDTSRRPQVNIRQINYLAELPVAPGGHVHYLTNATPHAPYVERGTSQMAAQPMVGILLVEIPQIYTAAAAKVRG